MAALGSLCVQSVEAATLAAGCGAARGILQEVEAQAAQLRDAVEALESLAELADDAITPPGWDWRAMLRTVLRNRAFASRGGDMARLA